MKGKRIGVVRGYAYTPDFWQFLKTEKNYESVTHDEQNFKKLNSGRIDFVIAEYRNALMLLKKKGLSDEIKPLLSHPVYTTDLYIILKRYLHF